MPPHIPEPDYDISDVENGSFSGSDSSWRDGGSSRGGASGGAPDQVQSSYLYPIFIFSIENPNILVIM